MTDEATVPVAQPEPPIDETRMSTCPLCGSNGEFEMAEPDRYLGIDPEVTHPYYICRLCSHHYQPVVPAQRLLSYYPPSYYSSDRSGGLRRTFAGLRQWRRARAVEWRASKGRAIDVGCGRGLVLVQLKELGWDVVGMDWNAENARAVAERLGIPVVAGPEGLRTLAPNSFDAASLFHVLEHEQQPLELLSQVHRLLKPGARLLVGVPNWASAARRLFGRNWMGYDFPRHRQVFTPGSLSAALDRTGFRVDRLTGRLSDELIDLQRSSRMMLREHGIRPPILVAVTAIGAAMLVIVPRLFGQQSVIYAYARRQ